MSIKQSFVAFLTAVKAWIVGLGLATESFLIGLHQRLFGAVGHTWLAAKSFVHHLALAVGHVALVPVHVLQWVWGCLKATNSALRSIWR